MDKVLNQVRQKYKQFSNKPSEGDINDIIQAAQELKNLKDTPGWRRVESFINRQRQGSEQLLDTEMGTLTLMSIPKLFNTFLKYLYILQERRAYKKIDNYIRLSIQNGEKYAQRRAKEEERKSNSDNSAKR